jgi:hypothetical protein
MNKEPDICENNHGGNPQSRAAHSKTSAAKDRLRVLEAIRRAEDGHTCDELEIELEMSHQTCSARCSELKRDQKIFASKTRRPTRTGCTAAVLYACPETT